MDVEDRAEVAEGGRGNPPVGGANVAAATRVCPLADIVGFTGVCALVGGEQVAVFRVGDEVLAIANLDPFSGAPVLSRGVVGDREGVLKVSSPLFKQSFDLRTGRCLDETSVAIPVYEAWVDDDGMVYVGAPPTAR